jgi:purine-binding chemotaxis protein CheW
MDSSSTKPVICLVWRSLGRIGAVPVKHVDEIMRPLPVHGLAGAPPFVAGVAIVRGRPTPIIDAAFLIAESRGTPARFVIVRIDEQRSVGLAVDEVVGIRELAATQLADLPPLLQESRGHVSRIASLDEELMVILETARIVPETVWAEIEGVDA